MFINKNKLLLFIVFILSTASNCSFVNLTAEKTFSNNESGFVENSSQPVREDFTEPVFSNFLNSQRYTEPIKSAWLKFTASGQYRLAKRSELKFSEETLKKYPGDSVANLYTPFTYAWGNLGYPMKEIQDHVAAIVVDTARSGNDKYSLVIFSPPQNNSKNYNVYWLHRNKDLSSYSLSAPSGYLIVQKNLEDGTIDTCYIEWSKKLNNFRCK